MGSQRRTVLIALTCMTLLAGACGSGKTSTDSASDGGVNATNLPDCPVGAFESATAPVEVVMWHSFVGKTGAALKQIIDTYNSSQTKVKVRLENQGKNYDELLKNYDNALAAKQLPALVAGEDTWTQRMVDTNATMPAQACMAKDSDPRAQLDDLLPGVRAAYTVGGVQWPAGFGVSTIVLYYNTDHFQKAGLDVTKPPTNLAELRAAAEALRKAGVSEAPLALKMDPWFIENPVSGTHTTLVDNDNGRNGSRATATTLDSPATRQLLDWLAGMTSDGLLNAISHTTLIDHYVAVATQKSSMLLETSTAATLIDQVTSSGQGLQLGDILDPEAAKQFEGFNGFKVQFKVGVGQAPGIEAPGGGQVGGSAFYISKTLSPEVVSAAWDFMKYFNQVDNQTLWTREGSYLPVRSEVQAQLEADPTWEASQRGQWITTAYESVQTLDPDFPGPLIGPYDRFREDVATMLEEITRNGQPAQAPARVDPALATAVSSINQAITKYNSTI